MASTNKPPPCQWRWDRFDAKKTTSVAWARRNCVGAGSDNPDNHQAMHRRVLQDEKVSAHIIIGELHQLLYDAAEITGMTYFCKVTQQTLACINNKDIRLAWVQDGGAANMQRLAWMFYFYGSEIHKLGRSCLTHGEWVERKIMNVLNVSYVHLTDLPIGQRSCLQQLYSKKFNDLRTNIMRGGAAVQHTSMIRKEQPKMSDLFRKNFKRGKTTFFATNKIHDNKAWQKVDFAVNKQWISWSEEALRRFLAKQGVSSSGPSLYPEICSQIKLTPAQSTKTNEGSLLFPPANGEPAFVTPSMFDDKPDTNRTEQIFGGLTNAMALEDSMWDINMSPLRKQDMSPGNKSPGVDGRIYAEIMDTPVFEAETSQVHCLLAKKCKAKEANREDVLANKLAFPRAYTNGATDVVLAKSKQTAVLAMMKPTKAKRKTVLVQHKKKTAQKGAKQTDSKENREPKAATKTKQPVAPPRKQPNNDCTKLTAVVHPGGCRHGDLSTLKSFTKTNASYYTRPNKFLEDGRCVDCEIAVTEMSCTTPRQKAVVFYCDAGNKGFAAPDSDPLKKELMCDLVLCPQCEAKRQIKFGGNESGHPGRGRKRTRQQKDV